MASNEVSLQLNQLLLQCLKELLDVLMPKLRANDEAILSIFRQALSQSGNR